jgi:phospholipid-binding lipoprotein MlaA
MFIVKPSRLMRFLCLTALVFLTACASQQTTMTDPERDPWEPFNRKVHAFNMGFDKAIARPIARGYDAILPEAPKRGVRNFFRNLAWPVTFINSILQGKIDNGMIATGRFIINSTVGLLGFFDVASRAGMPIIEEDFGQTLAVWGWKDSRFLMVPFIGPYTARDLLGRGFYGYAHPVSYMIRVHNDYRPLIVDLITLRASILPFQSELDNASDPYVLLRDDYLQRREYQIYDGDPPAPDYDAMLEEF